VCPRERGQQSRNCGSIGRMSGLLQNLRLLLRNGPRIFAAMMCVSLVGSPGGMSAERNRTASTVFVKHVSSRSRRWSSNSMRRLCHPTQNDQTAVSIEPYINISEFHDRPREAAKVWKLQKGTSPSVPSGRIRSAAKCAARSTANWCVPKQGRNGNTLMDLTLDWKEQFVGRGWHLGGTHD
jgi:hypothetical protein